MALKIRLRPQGRKNRETFRLVVTDCRSPHDGKYVEMLGWYNPFESEEDRLASVNPERIQFWLDQGAQLTEKAEALVHKLAPAIVKKQTEKVIAHKAKVTAKRKARKAAA